MRRTVKLLFVLFVGMLILVLGSSPLSARSLTTQSHWEPTGSFTIPRSGYTSTVLENGNVLVTGGYDSTSISLASTEIYNPHTGIWTRAGSMNTARAGHTATLLRSGLVLVSGGIDATTTMLASSEVYNPRTDTWTVTGSMHLARYGHSAVLLHSGNVFVLSYNTTESYNPHTGIWTATASPMIPGLHSETLTVLKNGSVLAVGGTGWDFEISLASAEIYHPSNDTWTATGSLPIGRTGHTATLLNNGQVLITGGRNILVHNFEIAATVLYTPGTGVWTETGSISVPRSYAPTILLSNDFVLVVGGYSLRYGILTSAELYNPHTGLWTPTASLPTGFSAIQANLLCDEKVLVTSSTAAEFYKVSR